MSAVRQLIGCGWGGCDVDYWFLRRKQKKALARTAEPTTDSPIQTQNLDAPGDAVSVVCASLSIKRVDCVRSGALVEFASEGAKRSLDLRKTSRNGQQILGSGTQTIRVAANYLLGEFLKVHSEHFHGLCSGEYRLDHSFIFGCSRRRSFLRVAEELKHSDEPFHSQG